MLIHNKRVICPLSPNHLAISLENALVVAGFLNSFICHADVVKIANAQAANSYQQSDLLWANSFNKVQITNGRAIWQLPPLSAFAAPFI